MSDLVVPDGAFTIGGGEWNYGQTMTEELGKSMFMLPELTPENILTILRLALERLPLDALEIFRPLLGIVDAFVGVGEAAATIIDNLVTKPLMVTLEMLGEWITGILQTLFPWVPWADIPTDLGNVLQWLMDSLHAIPFFGDFIQGTESFIEALIRNIVSWITNPGQILTALQGLFGNAGALIQTVISSFVYWLSHPGTLLTGIMDFLTNAFGQTGALLQHVIEGIIYWLTHPGQAGGIGYLLMEALKALFTNGGALIETVINSIIYWLTHPGEPGGVGYLLMEALKGLFAVGGNLVNTIISTVSYWLQNAGTLLNAFISAIITWLKGVGIDLTGGMSFIQAVVDNIARFFGQTGETLWSWAQNLVNINNLGTLIQGMFSNIFSVFPISMINTQEKVNLLNLGVFQTSSTLEAANGWSWDSGTTRTGSAGSAKLDCAGTSGVRTLYSNQNIRVVAGDRIAASSFIKTTSNFNSYPGAQLVLITFAGTTKYSEEVLATGTNTANQWSEITNSTTPYTVPSTVTSVQLALRVLSPINSGSIWWDDITLWKTGLMKQGLVEYLISAWQGLIGGLGVPSGGTPSPASATDPWNYTLQAGAGAKGTANTALGNAATADGKAVTADGKAVTAQGAATTAASAAATADGKAVTADGKAVTAQSSATTAASAAATADGKAVTADGKAVAAQSAAGTAASAAGTANSAATLADTLAMLSSFANNLVMSPDFDDVSVRRSSRLNPSGYTYTYTTEQARSGSSLRIVSSQTGANMQYLLSPVTSQGYEATFPVLPGQVYKFDIWAMAKSTNASTGALSLNFNISNVSGQGNSYVGASVAVSRGTWQRITGTYTIPTVVGSNSLEPTTMMPVFFVNNPVVNDVFYVDRALIYKYSG